MVEFGLSRVAQEAAETPQLAGAGGGDGAGKSVLWFLEGGVLFSLCSWLMRQVSLQKVARLRHN